MKTQVFLLTQINSHRCALRVTWPHQLSQCLSDHSLYSFRLSLSYSSCARVFTPSLSMNSCSTVAFIWSPRQLLQSDTGVPHFALDPLTYRCLLSPSPAADFAEPRPPRHKVQPALASRNEASSSRDAGSVASRRSVSFPRGTRVTYVAASEKAMGTRCPRHQTFRSLPSVEEHSYGKRTEEPRLARKSISRSWRM